MTRTKLSFVVTCAILCSISSILSADDTKSALANLLAKMPAENSAERNKFGAEFVKLGPAAIKSVCEMLVPPGTGDDTNARFALTDLAVYICRPGAEAEPRPCPKGRDERKMYAEVLISALKSATDDEPRPCPKGRDEVKAFLIRRLQLVGEEESVPVLAGFLINKRLCEPATQALLAIHTPSSTNALLKALPAVDASSRVTIIKALGELRSTAAAKEIINYADSGDTNTRWAALYALANIGEPSAADILAEAAEVGSAYDRAKAASFYLLFAQRLAEAGKKRQCAKICRDLIKTRTEPGESNIQCAALSTLVQAVGKRALKDIFKAVDSKNEHLHATALELALTPPLWQGRGKSATKKWIRKMKNTSPQVRAGIITMLGRRGDKYALPALLKALKDKNSTVRLASIGAAAQLGGNDALAPILALMQKTEQPDEIKAAKQTLMCISSSRLIPEIAAALPEATSDSQVALLEILADRRAKSQLETVFIYTKDDDNLVRLAAIKALAKLAEGKALPRLIELIPSAQSSAERSAAQRTVASIAKRIPDPESRADQLLTAIENTTGEEKSYLISTLALIGGKKALQTVVAETKSTDTAVKDAAIHALAEWPDIGAAGELLKIIRETQDLKYQIIAFRGYIRIVGKAELSAEEKIRMYRDAMALAERPEEKNLVLAGLAKVRTIESLRIVSTYLDNDNLRIEAALAAVNIACPQKKDKGLNGAEVATLLKKAIGAVEDQQLRENAQEYLNTIPIPPEEFTALFNGRDLAGWKGLVGDPVKRAKMSPQQLAEAQAKADEKMRDHWKVVDGVLAFDGKGHSLCTVKDYGDFEMLVDWKIESGGDSGIYLRGSPQVQIWDPANRRKGSGGLYNNKKRPNKPLRCADNPIGQWNTFRIIMVGEQVTVYLNDVLVVENVVLENYWQLGKPIYPTGQIELQSHSSPLYFRNIFIREIPRHSDFMVLFNDKDLTGWTGDTKGYVVEDGKIVCLENTRGNLYTEKQFSDFILRFEFKLTPGANNGLAIRAPLSGLATYEGMEIQILDDTADKYKDLKPYQYHGSIYGVVAAKRGRLKPAGQWNKQEVIAKGRHITVNLNDTTIVDADIDKASMAGTMDGKEHPGLKRDKGHIGFLSHGSRVQFRNIKIMELK